MSTLSSKLAYALAASICVGLSIGLLVSAYNNSHVVITRQRCADPTQTICATRRGAMCCSNHSAPEISPSWTQTHTVVVTSAADILGVAMAYLFFCAAIVLLVAGPILGT